MIFLVILLFVFLVFMLVCAIKESAITSVYKANNVYGRFTAYIALDLLLFGAAAIIGSVVLLIFGLIEVGVMLILMLVGILCLGGAILIYRHALKKCPESLKKKCIGSMFISGCGVAMKLGVFYFTSVWKLYAYTGTASSGGFASRYVRTNSGDEYVLQSTFNQTALLRHDMSGATVEVYSHGSNGDVRDQAGNIYSPM